MMSLQILGLHASSEVALEGILVPAFVFLFFTSVILIPKYFSYKTKMKAIEKGIYVPSKGFIGWISRSRSAIECIAKGIGFLAASLVILTIMVCPKFFGLDEYQPLPRNFITPAFLFFGLGAGFLTYGILKRKSEKENETPQP